MIFKNIELHNIDNIQETSRGYEMFRFPHEFLPKFYFGEQAIRLSSGPTGVEFRFVMIGDTMTITLAKKYIDKDNPNYHNLCIFHIFYGSIQGTYADHNKFIETDEEYKLIIKKPDNLDVLKEYTKVNDEGFSPNVIRIIVDSGYILIKDVEGDVRPPRADEVPSKTILTYGSSITHGSNSLNTSYTWANLLAREFKYDLLNKAMAGSCALEKEVVDYLADLGKENKWNVGIFELGINVIFWEEKEIREKVTYLIDTVASNNPDKPIYIISPLYCNDDFYQKGNGVRWRKLIEEIVDNLSYSNVTYINGLSLLDSPALLCADEVHPNIYGVRQVADRLIKLIVK